MRYTLSLIIALSLANLIPAVGESYPALVGDEPFPVGVRLIPRPDNLGRDEANLVGERFEAGTTFYDYQANGTVGKQIALDEDGNVHLVWMKSVQDFGAGERHCYYNYLIDGEPQIDGGANADGLARGGYCNVSYSPAFGASPVFHANQDNGQVWTFWAKDEENGAGAFTPVRAPRDGGDEYIWPKGAVDRNGRAHVLMRHRNEDANANSTTLMYSNGIMGENDWEFGEPAIAGVIKQISYVVAASDVSDKVALIFPTRAYPEGENARFAGTAGAPAANNDVVVFESENGVDFDWDNPINVTRVLRPNPNADQNSPFYQGDTLRPVLFVDGCYDANDNLHVVFSSVSFWEAVDPNANPGYDANRYDEKRNMLWHWDRDSDGISLIASGRYSTDGNVGTWRQNLSFPSLGAAEDGTIYCAWTQFPAEGDRAGNGYVQGEIFANCSQDGGMTWSQPIDLTETHAANAQAGESQAECWSSLAGRVDDYLHISYVYDLDAGAVVQGEGQVTENTFFYQRVARDDIPTGPLQLGRDFHVGLPPEVAVAVDQIDIVAVPGGDAGLADLVISNPADASTGLWFSLAAPDGMAEVLSFEPSAGRIEAGGELNVTVRFSPIEQGVIEGNLLLYHNAPGLDSPIEISFHGLAAAGFGRLHGTVSDLSNGENIEGAEIRLTPGGYSASSDANGQYAFDRVPAWNYRIVCFHPDFLPNETQVEVQVDGEVASDFEMKYGTFEVEDRALEISVSVDEEFESEIRIHNNGNGSVNFTSSLVFPGGEIEQYSERQYFAAAQVVGDNRLNGAAFVGDRFFVSGGNNGQGRGVIHMFDHDGASVGSFSQFFDSPWGMRDLAWDGTYLWGGDGRVIYVFDIEGNLIRSFDGPLNPCRSLAWDSDREIMWISDVRSNIFGINSEGAEQARFRQLDTTRIYGLAYFSQDPDGFPLYIVSSTATHPNLLYKVNPDNCQFRVVADLPVPEGCVAGGIEITTDYDPYNYVLIECVTGIPDGVAVYQLTTRTDWVSLTPETGVVEAEEPTVATVTFDSHNMPIEQRFETTARFEHNGRGEAVEVPVSMTVTEEGGVTRRALTFELGWNTVSLNIEPETPAIAELTRPLLEAGLLMMVKDDRGRFYSPSHNFNDIGDWSPSEGYQFKLSQAGRLDVVGLGIAFNRPLALTAGWQMVSYYPRASATVEIALAGIAEQLQVVKDGLGHFYLPAYQFSNMDPMREGRGYHVKVNADVELTYQLGQAASLALAPVPVHFPEPSPTEANMSVLLVSVPSEIIEIAAIGSSDRSIGSGVVDAKGRCGMAVWGASEDKTGLRIGESFHFVGWDGEKEIAIDTKWSRGGGAYEPNGLAIGNAVVSEIVPISFALYEPYPNPFNSTTKIRFDLPETGRVNAGLFDATGREVVRLIDQTLESGRHNVTLQASELPSGIYILRIVSGNHRASVKAVLIR